MTGARPEVRVENAADVYRFYGPGRRRDRFTHALLTFVDALYAPELRIRPEVVEEVHRLHDAGVGIIVAANHPSGHDPLVLASAVHDRRVRFLAAGTGLTKDPLFRGPLRPVFEYTGTVPVFRAKNYAGVPSEIHLDATRRLIGLCVRRLLEGGVVLTFVEGTNSSTDDLRTLRLESVKRGVGEMVVGARAEGGRVARDSTAGGRVAVLPIGIAYHGREHRRLPPRRAVVATGTPLVWPGAVSGPATAADPAASLSPEPSVDEVRAAVRDGIDAALTDAWR